VGGQPVNIKSVMNVRLEHVKNVEPNIVRVVRIYWLCALDAIPQAFLEIRTQKTAQTIHLAQNLNYPVFIQITQATTVMKIDSTLTSQKPKDNRNVLSLHFGSVQATE